MKPTDVAIVGAGPAGLAAAQAARNEGCTVTIIDDQDTPGGQFFRQPSALLGQTGRDRFSSKPAIAQRLFRVLDDPAVDYRPSTTVWNIPDSGVLALACEGSASRLHAKTTIVAAGAHDRCVPFPGWTLPGVMTAGGAQNLLKGQRVLPGQRTLVTGNGPLTLVVAASILRAGGHLAAVTEAAPVSSRLPGLIAGLLAVPSLLMLAASYRARLVMAGVPLLNGHTIVEARGADKVEEVVVARLCRDGVPEVSHSQTYAVDSVVVGYGLQCSSELTRLAGCELSYRQLSGGWIPRRGHWLESTLPGLFVGGDSATISGGETALTEGALAGLGAAKQARGALSAAGARRADQLRSKLIRLARFRTTLEQLFEVPASFAALRRPDTIICRCEDVTAGQIEDLCRDSDLSLSDIKTRTRASMGRCQGRNCLAGIAEMVAAIQGKPIAELDWPRGRAPARLVPISALLCESIKPPVMPADPHLPRAQPTAQARPRPAARPQS